VENIQFLLDFAQGGNLKQTVSELKEVQASYESILKINKQLQIQVAKSATVKEFSSLLPEIEKLKKGYKDVGVEIDNVNKKKKEAKILTDEEISQQVKAQHALNERKKAVRELIKDETALKNATKAQIKSIEDLRNQTNALVRIRDKMDTSTRQGKKEFDGLTQKINTNTDALKKHDLAIGRSQRNVGNYASAFKGIGSTILALGGISLGAMAVGSFMRDSTEAFKEFDKQLKEVSAITGLVGADLEFFAEKAKEVGSSTTTSASEYLNAIKLIGSARPELLKDKVALAEVTDQALILSQASGLDLPVAASALTSSLNQFNLSGEESARVINALAAASKEGAVEVPELDEAMKNVGTVAAGANLTLEETISFLEILGEKGLKGAEGGTKLRGSLLQLQKAGLGFKSGKFNVAEALKEAEKQLNSIQDPAKRAQKEIKLFGAENITAGKILLQNQDKYKELTKAITGTNTATEQATINNRSAAAQSEILSNKLEVLKIGIGEKLIPILNSFKSALIGILEYFGGVIDGFNELSTAVDKNAGYFEGLNNLHHAGKINTLELFDATKKLSLAYKVLGESTKETQIEGEALIKSLQTGKINIVEFYREVDKLRALELKRRNQNKKTAKEKKDGTITDATGDLVGGEQGSKDKALADAKAFREQQYQNDLKAIEREKTLNETAIERSISNEEEKTQALKQVNVDYLEKKLIIEHEYNKEFEKTELEFVRAQLDALKKANKDKVDETKKTKEELAQEELDQDELEAEWAANEIEMVQYVEDKKAEIRKQAEEEAIEMAISAMETITQAYSDALDLRIEKDQNALEKQKLNVERQESLAERGLENTLAQEKAIQAEKEKQLLIDQKKQQKLKEMETFFNLMAAYAQKDPNTAAAKAFVQVQLSKAIAARLEDGGVISDEVAKQNGGILQGNSHKRGGILIEAEGSEGIFSKKEMARLGKDNFYAIKDSLKTGSQKRMGLSVQNDSMIALVNQKQGQNYGANLTPLLNEMKGLKQAINDKPVPSFLIDRNGNLITRTETSRMIKTTIFKNNKPKGFNS